MGWGAWRSRASRQRLLPVTCLVMVSTGSKSIVSSTILAEGRHVIVLYVRLLRDAHRRLSLASKKDIDMGLCLPPSLSEETLHGFTYFRLLSPLLDHLHRAATERDRARNRQLFYDQYASLL